MMPRRSVVAPAVVLTAAVLSGGWFLQRGVGQEQNLYFQARLFQEVVDHVSRQYVEEVDKGELYESAIDGLLQQLGDPNTSFISATQYEDIRIRTMGDYGGVGLEITERDGFITVVSPIPGTPGDRAGIRPGDQFFEIAGESAQGWTVEQAVDALRGQPGSEVDVRMLRPGVDEPIPFTLSRAEIHLKAVPFTSMLENGVLYIPLRIFRETSSSEIREAVGTLSSGTAVEGVVLDLRGNPGGLLEEGIGVSDLFLPPGTPVVETRGRAAGQDDTYNARGTDFFDGVPVVVLVDGASASASEIVAGALQDHDRALVVGMPTFGKGSVQTLFQLSGGNVLRLTTARWYTPSGRSIQKESDEEGVEAAPAPVVAGTLTLDGRIVPRPDTAGRPTFESAAGRTLYGGGGITPDVVVFPDSLTTLEQTAVQALYRDAASLARGFFNYAVGYIQERPGLPRTFELSPADLDRFIEMLPDFGVRADLQHARQAERFLRYRLTREIALLAWGEAAEFERARQFDSQLRRALDALSRSRTPAELFRAAAADAASSPAQGSAAAPGGSRGP
jgi:carboxyl-terminal processing protease